MNYIQVTITAADVSVHEILIALLADCEYESFVEEGNILKAYIVKDKYNEEQLNEHTGSFDVTVNTEEIAQQNWNAEWEKNFSPVRVGDFCMVRADFHAIDDTVEHDIIITPKMSFGTGHHATTRLMIEQMRGIEIQDKDVLDFGTGTGVLAILACKLGAANVTAIDNDEWSFENVQENIRLNNTQNIETLLGSLEVLTGVYDIILANINRHILMRYMTEMSTMLKAGGHLIVSGILEEDVNLVVAEAQKNGLSHKESVLMEKWACIKFDKTI